jgi:hypothetical protein
MNFQWVGVESPLAHGFGEFSKAQNLARIADENGAAVGEGIFASGCRPPALLDQGPLTEVQTPLEFSQASGNLLPRFSKHKGIEGHRESGAENGKTHDFQKSPFQRSRLWTCGQRALLETEKKCYPNCRSKVLPKLPVAHKRWFWLKRFLIPMQLRC